MKPLPQRKSPRLQGYDYSLSGLYFITICVYQRQHLFGSISNGSIELTTAGQIAAEGWLEIPKHYPDVVVENFVIMPNHMHGILCLRGDNAGFKTYLGRVINSYKGAVTARIRKQQADSPLDVPTKIWQGRYHDHIIRSETVLQRIEAYIENNPALWSEDVFFTER
jgi:putative transposase